MNNLKDAYEFYIKCLNDPDSLETGAMKDSMDWVFKEIPNALKEIEALKSSEKSKENSCSHNNKTPKWDHVKCDDCGAILASKYGFQSSKDRIWFKNMEQAKHFHKTGVLL